MSNYFNIKYVSEGPYFNVKGGTPPAPTLPTVTYLSTVYGLLSTASIASGGTSSPLKARVGGVYDGDYFTKDNSKQYAFFRYNNGVGYKNAGGIFEVAWSQDNYLCAKNVSDGAEDLESVRIAECSSADAQVVTVYDIEYGYASYAFKFNLSGTYYYSILDSGLHPGEWTDDLAAAGYTEDSPEPPVVLPTVSVTGDFGANNWLYRTSGGTVMSIAANSQENLWNATGSGYVNVSYDTSKAYAVILWYFGTGSGDKGQNGVLSVVNNSGDIAARNNTSSSVNLYALRCAVCSDSTATVVTVYDSSNVAYNAFKFTASGTDYYYVLDGTQTDWTDDLAGIGYSLYATIMFGVYYDVGWGGFWDTKDFSANDWWWTGIVNQSDATTLSSMGIGVSTADNVFGPNGCMSYDLVHGDYCIFLDGFYNDAAGTEPSQYQDIDNFFFADRLKSGANVTAIYSINSATGIKCYKCRIGKSPSFNAYFSADETAQQIASDTYYPMYANGQQITVEQGRKYLPKALYNSDDLVITDDMKYIRVKAQDGLLYIAQTYSSSITVKYIKLS